MFDLSETYHTANSVVRLEVKIVHPLGKIPTRTRSTDAGYDLYAVTQTILKPHSATICETGIRLSCPPGWYMTIDGRSSLWRDGISPNRGIIDSTYCGNLCVSLVNHNDFDYMIRAGDRIAQITLHKQYDAVFAEVDDFSTAYNQRGQAGFGSTGK